MNSSRRFFPFPLVHRGEHSDGCLISWSSICQKCISKQCESLRESSDPVLCSYGYHFQRVDQDTIIAGILIKESPIINDSQKKRRRKQPEQMVSLKDFKRAVIILRQFALTLDREIDLDKVNIINEYKRLELYKSDFLNSIKETMKQNLSFVHDYKQINTQISQQINVIIETKYIGSTLEEKLEKANDQEKAIYWASKLLEEKLIVTRFLLDPSWFLRREDCSTFRFHGLVYKYLKVYEPFSKLKSLLISVNGTSYNNIFANGKAVPIIPHTLIDNAIKYSPKGGKIEILLQDLNRGVLFSITSMGPQILHEELEKIFEPFYRGKNAIKQEEEGTGYGLYVSQLIAIEHLGTRITIDQSPKGNLRDGYKTTFSIEIPPMAAALQ